MYWWYQILISLVASLAHYTYTSVLGGGGVHRTHHVIDRSRMDKKTSTPGMKILLYNKHTMI